MRHPAYRYRSHRRHRYNPEASKALPRLANILATSGTGNDVKARCAQAVDALDLDIYLQDDIEQYIAEKLELVDILTGGNASPKVAKILGEIKSKIQSHLRPKKFNIGKELFEGAQVMFSESLGNLSADDQKFLLACFTLWILPKQTIDKREDPDKYIEISGSIQVKNTNIDVLNLYGSTTQTGGITDARDTVDRMQESVKKIKGLSLIGPDSQSIIADNAPYLGTLINSYVDGVLREYFSVVYEIEDSDLVPLKFTKIIETRAKATPVFAKRGGLLSICDNVYLAAAAWSLTNQLTASQSKLTSTSAWQKWTLNKESQSTLSKWLSQVGASTLGSALIKASAPYNTFRGGSLNALFKAGASAQPTRQAKDTLRPRQKQPQQTTTGTQMQDLTPLDKLTPWVKSELLILNGAVRSNDNRIKKFACHHIMLLLQAYELQLTEKDISALNQFYALCKSESYDWQDEDYQVTVRTDILDL